jgi:hypothetical protein
MEQRIAPWYAIKWGILDFDMPQVYAVRAGVQGVRISNCTTTFEGASFTDRLNPGLPLKGVLALLAVGRGLRKFCQHCN